MVWNRIWRTRRPAAVALLLAAAVLYVHLAGRGAGPAASEEYYDCTPVRTEGSSQTSGAGGLMTGSNVDQLTDEADLVVFGAVESFQTCRSTGPVTIVTRIRIATGDVFKADRLPPTALLTVDVPGGAIDGYRLAVGTSPEFTVGEQVVVFLGITDDGEVFPAAGFQGKFTVTPDLRLTQPAVSLSEMRGAVHTAAEGDLPPDDDPLEGGPQIIESAYSTLGVSFIDGEVPVQYYINASAGKPAQLTEQETRLASIRAFHAWQNLPGSYIAFGPVQNTTRTSAQGGCDGLHDTTWGLSISPHGSGTLAVAYTCYIGSQILDADIEIDTDHFGSAWRVDGSGACFTGTYDLQTVLLHENGHFLGLGHPGNSGCQPCPVMDASYGGVSRTPCADDDAGASAVYPLAGGTPPPAPGAFSASGTESALLGWSDVASEWGYELWRAPLSCETVTDPDFALLDTVADGTLAYTDTDYGNGMAGGSYCYKARAFNDSGESAFTTTSGVDIEGSTPTPSPSPTPTPTPSPSPSPEPPQSPPPAPTSTPSPHVQGDADCNETVDMSDLLAVLQTLGGTAVAPCSDYADVNCDGIVSGADAVIILRHISQLPSAIPDCPPVGATSF
ncbi:MAG: matrixin family metalloprotease [Chloroflexi bacterium]|nr:matrixin family metalloprotease [Chloroflexota bacterium]